MTQFVLNMFSIGSSTAYKTHKIKIKVPNEDSEYVVRLNGVNNKFPELFNIIDEIGVEWKQYLQTFAQFLQQILRQNVKAQQILIEYRKIASQLIDVMKLTTNSIQEFVGIFEPLAKRIERFNNSSEFIQIYKQLMSNRRSDILSIKYSLKNKEIKIKKQVERFNKVFYQFYSTFKQ